MHFFASKFASNLLASSTPNSDVRFLRLNFLGRTPDAELLQLRAEIEDQRWEARVGRLQAGGQRLKVKGGSPGFRDQV